MLTLDKGYKKPQPQDTGDVVFPALADDIQQLNDHTHNGVDSQLLAVQTQTISAWTDLGNGTYESAVTMPDGYDYDLCQMMFKLATGEIVYPSVDRVDSTHFKIYTNNPQDYIAIYR